MGHTVCIEVHAKTVFSRVLNPTPLDFSLLARQVLASCNIACNKAVCPREEGGGRGKADRANTMCCICLFEDIN